jgi:hypothetical protein
VEDRLATLKNVIKEPELDGWNLYLGKIPLSIFHPLALLNTLKLVYHFCLLNLPIIMAVCALLWFSLALVTNLYFGLGDWGYNTQKERDEAATIPRIQILQLSDFSKKLK